MKTDTQLQKDVLVELGWDASVNAAHIGVEVDGGVVTLVGHVMSFSEKWHAERAAQRVAGVKALAVEIDVKLPGFSTRTDVDIARTAENALSWVTYVPDGAIKVKVEDGWISLTGRVDWHYQRQGAVSAVRYLMGVKGVTDLVELKAATSQQAVKADIEAALKRRAADESNQIVVAVNGNDVTLTGTVHSWSERELARYSAWGTPNVSNVVDNLTIEA